MVWLNDLVRSHSTYCSYDKGFIKYKEWKIYTNLKLREHMGAESLLIPSALSTESCGSQGSPRKPCIFQEFLAKPHQQFQHKAAKGWLLRAYQEVPMNHISLHGWTELLLGNNGFSFPSAFFVQMTLIGQLFHGGYSGNSRRNFQRGWWSDNRESADFL